MNASIYFRSSAIPRVLSQGAKVCAAILFSAWLTFVVAEFFISHFSTPDREMVYQAITLSVVFVGYALSIKYPVAGSCLTFLAVALFFVTSFATTGAWPPIGAVLFASPAVLSLGAWGYRRARRLRRRQRANTRS